MFDPDGNLLSLNQFPISRPEMNRRAKIQRPMNRAWKQSDHTGFVRRNFLALEFIPVRFANWKNS